MGKMPEQEEEEEKVGRRTASLEEQLRQTEAEPGCNTATGAIR